MNHITDYRPLIIGINGSPNKEEYLGINGRGLSGMCQDGSRCPTDSVQRGVEGIKSPLLCSLSITMQSRCAEGKPLEKALQSLGRADGIIIGSPVYFGTFPASLKPSGIKPALSVPQAIAECGGGAIAVGGSPYGGQETAVQAIHHMMLVHGMLVVGDGYIDDDCGHLGAMAQRPSLEDGHALERVGILAKRVVQVARATRGIRVDRG